MNHRKIGRTVILLLSALMLAPFGYTQVEVSRIQRRCPPQGAFVSTADGTVDIHYLRRGSGQPVVMLHGRDGSLQEFTLSIFDAVSNNYEAIALERPGYGYSKCLDPDKLTTETQARLINEALTRLGVEKPIIVGHSYGGAVMLQYLLDYPDRVSGAISLAGVAYMDEPPDEGVFALPRYPVVGPLMTKTIVVPFGRAVAQGMYEQAFWPADAPEAYVEAVSSLYIRPDQFTATAYELAGMYESVNEISPQYGDIGVPVIIIFGKSDQMLSYEKDGLRLYDALPDANLILMEDAGHKVHHTHPHIVMDALGRLIERIDERNQEYRY